MSLVIDHLIEGFALFATTLHPEVFLTISEQARSERETGKRRTAPRSESDPTIVCGTGVYGPLTCFETARGDVAGRRTWIFSITSFFAEIWSRMLREREIRHIRAAWKTIDDRTLKDIGISRYEIEYARDARHWS
jgi:uncharacterized protein YjiS (DUF1127 family)